MKVGDRVVITARADAPKWMKEIEEFDPIYGTVLRVDGDRVEINPKGGDAPFWTEVSRCKPAYF